MNELDLMAKMNEVLDFAKACHAESVELRIRVESLQAQVEKLDERLTYRERVLVGWKEIADYLGCTERYAQSMADEPFDPLPILKDHGRAVAYTTAIDAHRMRHRSGRNTERRKVARLVPRETGETPS